VVSNTSKLKVFKRVDHVWSINFLVFRFVWEKVPAEHITVPSARDETRVVVKPVKASYWTSMELVDHVSILTSVELVDVDVTLRSTGKEMTSIGESNLSASLNSYVMEWFKALLEHIHHSDSISESNNDMESRRMKSYTVSFIVVRRTNFKSWCLVLLVVPNSHGLVDRASSN